MEKQTEITCACGCGLKRMVRVIDVKRGWGKYYNRSHQSAERNRLAGEKRRELGVGYKSKIKVPKFNENDLFSKTINLMHG